MNQRCFSNLTNFLFVVIAAILCVTSVIYADEEPSKDVRVISSADGYYYARTIPQGKAFDATNGITRIYRVGIKEDELLDIYNWYAWGLDLVSTGRGISVVRLGRWASGYEARKEDFAIGFYLGGKTIKEYSTLDIAGGRGNVSRSISHYRVFKEVGNIKYQWGSINLDTNTVPEFIVKTLTTDGRCLEFDVTTGEIINKSRQSFHLYDDTLTKSQKEFAEAYRTAHDNQDLVALSRLVNWGKTTEDERLRWFSLSMPYLIKPLYSISFRTSALGDNSPNPGMLNTEWLCVNHGPIGWVPSERIATNHRDQLVFSVGITNGTYFFVAP